MPRRLGSGHEGVRCQLQNPACCGRLRFNRPWHRDWLGHRPTQDASAHRRAGRTTRHSGHPGSRRGECVVQALHRSPYGCPEATRRDSERS